MAFRIEKAQQTTAPSPYLTVTAPGYIDDFYYTNLDWSSKNIVAVALGAQLFTYNPVIKKAQLVKEYKSGNHIYSIELSEDGSLLASSSKYREVDLISQENFKTIRKLNFSHEYPEKTTRIMNLAWNWNHLIAFASRKKIILTDIRQKKEDALSLQVSKTSYSSQLRDFFFKKNFLLPFLLVFSLFTKIL